MRVTGSSASFLVGPLIAFGGLGILVLLLRDRSGASISYSELARTVNVTVDTAKRWTKLLVSLLQGISELIKRIAVMRGDIPDPYDHSLRPVEAEAERLLADVKQES